MTESDSKAKRDAYIREYNRREYVMQIKRDQSLAAAHKKKVLTTKKRLEELSMKDLLYIAYLKCEEAGVDFESKKAELESVLRLLHKPETI